MSGWRDTLSDYVTATRRAQGLPDRVEDPSALAKVATLLRSHPSRTLFDGRLTGAQPTSSSARSVATVARGGRSTPADGHTVSVNDRIETLPHKVVIP